MRGVLRYARYHCFGLYHLMDMDREEPPCIPPATGLRSAALAGLPSTAGGVGEGGLGGGGGMCLPPPLSVAPLWPLCGPSAAPLWPRAALTNTTLTHSNTSRTGVPNSTRDSPARPAPPAASLFSDQPHGVCHRQQAAQHVDGSRLFSGAPL